VRFIPCSEADRREMLRAIGARSMEELLGSIPGSLRLRRDLALPPALGEAELAAVMDGIAASNRSLKEMLCFLGAGAYRHYVPAAVDAVISRAEFFTSYTPYQPEVSQGTLQAIFEYQTMICQLTGMEVANASLYDGASSLAEAVLMAHRLSERRRIIVAKSLHPEYRRVLATYLSNLDLEVVEVGFGRDGRVSESELAAACRHDAMVVCVQSPNFFGVVERLDRLFRTASGAGALTVAAVAEPFSLGLLAAPGAQGADIVCGEGQAFGNAVAFGGPYLGFFATRGKFVRQVPGRLVGEARDVDGRRGFVLTLSTREQHIRRGKATSNICTNQGLCALAASVHLALLGRRGRRDVARLAHARAEYAKKLLGSLRGCRIAFGGPTFNEFVLQIPASAAAIHERLLERGIVAGLPLESSHPELGDALLLCFTELTDKGQIDALAEALHEAF
jgi:glycine dehydrogenase subunit 1